MYYWICQKCNLKVWGAENCWCGITREQNSALAEQRNKKGIVTVEKFIAQVRREQKEYLKKIEQLPPKDIIVRAYEICYRNELLYILETKEFDDEDIKVLAGIPNLLGALYCAWLNDDASVSDMLEDVIHNFVERNK